MRYEEWPDLGGSILAQGVFETNSTASSKSRLRGLKSLPA